MGYLPLREAVAEYLGAARGVRCDSPGRTRFSFATADKDLRGMPKNLDLNT